jgi:ATP-dependent helicase/nuclease subunit B
MDHERSLPLLFPDDPAEPVAEATGSSCAEAITDATPAARVEMLPEDVADTAPAASAGTIPVGEDGVAEALDRGATVVTANQRTARTLQRSFEQRKRAAGATSWQPPELLAWDTWTATLWRRMLLDGHAANLLLSTAQEHQVWRSIVAHDSAWNSLETVDALAGMAASAWGLLSAYRAHARLRSAASNENTEDTRAFLRWAQAFRRRCERDAYLSEADLEETILHAVEVEGFSIGSRELLLVGFDKMTPVQTALIAALRDAGVTISSWTPALDAALHLHAAKDPEAELQAAACWIRQFLEADASNSARVAVILPSANVERAEVDRIFREVLAPELLPITAGSGAAPYEFSLGQPLARVPMIAVAIDLLRWSKHSGHSENAEGSQATLPLESVSRLLLSPFFTSDESERGPRAEFDAFELRRSPLLRPEMSLDALIARAESSRRAVRLGGLLRQLRSLRRTAASIFSGDLQRPYADWADAIRQLLQSANWTASNRDARGEDSITFQARRKWESTLDQLATLDFEGARPSFREALDALHTLLQETLFAPESREAPVQIMGPLEAGGSEFDAVWFLRAGDLDWPVRSSINPLLGWPLQRAAGMPGADTAAEREHARRITQRIAASAPTVVFSYARETSESPQRPSTLLSDLAFERLASITGLDVLQAAGQAAVELEATSDDVRIPLRNPLVRGGASVLKSQAACGFRAFAERRLWSTELETAEPGMDARERGDLVHVTLQRLWDEVRSQAELRAMSPEDRSAALDRAIAQALDGSSEAATSPWETAYVDTQRERLHRLLAPWIEQELARQLPFTVKAREEAMEVAVGPLRLKLRIDRIDATEAGDVLIDYKTGTASHKDWLTERPDEPQLPLYAMITEAQLAAIAFARIRPGKEMGLDGYAATNIIQDGILPKPAALPFETLDDQVAEWRRVLTQLAEDFHAGDARVYPKSYPKTCQHCAQRLLCRLDPASLGDPEEHAEAGEHEHPEEIHG